MGTPDAGSDLSSSHHLHETPMATATAAIDWKRNAEAALNEARRTGRMVLLDFSAAPM
jgi:hypothetical protein